MTTALPTYTITTHSDDETRAWGCVLGEALRPGDIVALQGELGAGKTTFTQGIGQGMGVTARITSPTFTLVNEYEGRAGVRLIHTDSYRLGDLAGLDDGDGVNNSAVREAATFGMADILDGVADGGEAVIVIEWAERLADLLPDDYLAVALGHVPGDETTRTLAFLPHGPRSEELLQKVRDQRTEV